MAGVDGISAILSYQSGNLVFSSNQKSFIRPVLKLGSSYFYRLVIQTGGATSFSTTSAPNALRALTVTLTARNKGVLIRELNQIMSMGLSAKGSIVQSVIVTGEINAKVQNESFVISVIEQKSRALKGLRGSFEIFEIEASVLSSSSVDSRVKTQSLTSGIPIQEESKTIRRDFG
jgi:hypothetical protein